jgi:zinc/manganese transport system ATP-binding protein
MTATLSAMVAPANQSSVIIETKELVAGYRDKIVWRNANFGISRGEFVAVIGPNGAGKTTLFRLLLGLQSPISGSMKVFGATPKRGNERIGFVPQRHLVDVELNTEALELVRLGYSGKKWGFSLTSQEDRKIAIQAMESVGAGDLMHRSLGVLSGGELQRVFLAEALVSSPELLLLDEPLSNLDIRREKELVELVNTVVRTRQVTALLIAHNINPVLPFLDRIIYIANGKVATGKPKDVLTSESLSALYGVEIEVLQDSKGNLAIISSEDNQFIHTGVR